MIAYNSRINKNTEHFPKSINPGTVEVSDMARTCAGWGTTRARDRKYQNVIRGLKS